MSTSHDQNFKNLIIDYPRQALAFFAPTEAAILPPDVKMNVSLDRSVMIRSSLRETAMTLLLSVVLVVLVVLAFLRSWQAVIIPAAAIAIFGFKAMFVAKVQQSLQVFDTFKNYRTPTTAFTS